MAYAIETTLAGFFADLPLAGLSIDLSDSIELKSTAGGDIITAENGARYWFGSAVLGTNGFADHESHMARLRALTRGNRSWLLSPRHHDGTDKAFPAAAARLSAVTSNRLVTFSAAGTSLLYRRGTFFSLNYGGIDRLFQIAEDATSTSGGVLGPVEVVPDLETGFVVGASGTIARFKEPVCRAIILPGSLRSVVLKGHRAEGIAFEWRQQLLA